jgi:serine/threonine protein kinase
LSRIWRDCRRVALKVLTDRLLRDTKQKLRFEREAKAAAKLHHTNIVPVFGTGEHRGTPYYVMQFIQGMSLDTVIEELARIGLDIGRVCTKMDHRV